MVIVFLHNYYLSEPKKFRVLLCVAQLYKNEKIVFTGRELRPIYATSGVTTISLDGLNHLKY